MDRLRLAGARAAVASSRVGCGVVGVGMRREVIGDCELWLGDCLEIIPEIGAADAIITDPPYKLSQEYGSGADADNLVAVSSIWPAARMMEVASRPGAICAMFYDTRILPLALDAMRKSGWRYLRNLTLYRRWGAASVVHGWMSTSDFVLIFAKSGAKPEFHGTVFHDVFVKEKAEPENAGHPAQKPNDLLLQIVGRASAVGETILDPFMGSGTTGVACVNLGRRFIGIEIDEKYHSIACRRIEAAYAQPRLFEEPAVKAVQETML